MKHLIITLFLLTLLTYSILNLGRFLDVAQEPEPSDVVACLSGCDKYRMAKMVELYRQGYVKRSIIILTSPEPLDETTQSNAYCKKHTAQLQKEHIADKVIVCSKQISNTMQELLAVKEYLLAHHLKSALIVTDPPITRRASFLADKIADFGKSELKVNVVGSNAPWWDREHYYSNKTANAEVILEVVKLPYNYIKYGILYSLFAHYGILNPARKLLSPIADDIKRAFASFLWKM